MAMNAMLLAACSFIILVASTWAESSRDDDGFASPSVQARCALKELVRGVTGGFQSFWERRTEGPMIMKGDGRNFSALLDVHKFGAIFDGDHAQRIRRSEPIRWNTDVGVSRTGSTGMEENAFVRENQGQKVSGAKIVEFLNEGWTVVVPKAYKSFGPVFLLVSLLEQALNMPVSAAFYVTPPGEQGLDFHFDNVGVFFLQIQGSKLWTVFPPFVEDPIEKISHLNEEDAPPGILAGKTEFLVEEGDIFWIPRGWFHRGRTHSAQTSVHLTLSPEKVMWAEFVQALGLGDDIKRLEGRGSFEMRATQTLPLPLRRELPAPLASVPDADFIAGLRQAAEAGGVQSLGSINDEELIRLKEDYLANMTSELMPPPATYLKGANRLYPERSKDEIAGLGLHSSTPLRVTSPMAARLLSHNHVKKKRGNLRAVLKYSTVNTNRRYERTAPPFGVSLDAAASLKQVLHAEKNPSGRFRPADIQGIGDKERLRLATWLVSKRIVVPETEWHSGEGGFGVNAPAPFMCREAREQNERTEQTREEL